MGLFGRSKISEIEAVNKIVDGSVDCTVNEVGRHVIQNAGPLLMEIFPEFPATFLKDGVNMCFVTTVLVLETGALPNIFPPAQAARLRALTVGLLDAMEKHGRGVMDVPSYFCQVEAGLARAFASSSSVVDELGEVLFDALGLPRTVEFAGNLYRDPLAVKVLGSTCIGLASGRWKQLASNYRVT